MRPLLHSPVCGQPTSSSDDARLRPAVIARTRFSLWRVAGQNHATGQARAIQEAGLRLRNRWRELPGHLLCEQVREHLAVYGICFRFELLFEVLDVFEVHELVVSAWLRALLSGRAFWRAGTLCLPQ